MPNNKSHTKKKKVHPNVHGTFAPLELQRNSTSLQNKITSHISYMIIMSCTVVILIQYLLVVIKSIIKMHGTCIEMWCNIMSKCTVYTVYTVLWWITSVCYTMQQMHSGGSGLVVRTIGLYSTADFLMMDLRGPKHAEESYNINREKVPFFRKLIV